MSDSPKPPLLAVQVASQPLTLDELKTVLTPSPKPPTPAEIEEVRERHMEITHNYGDEPWADSCVEDGEQAHKDRGLLLRAYDAMAARSLPPALTEGA